MSYDTSARQSDARERVWMDGGDLRYWTQKGHKPSGRHGQVLHHGGGHGSSFAESKEVLNFKYEFDRLYDILGQFEIHFSELGRTSRVALAARMQTRLRDALTDQKPFDGETFRQWLRIEMERLERFILV